MASMPSFVSFRLGVVLLNALGERAGPPLPAIAKLPRHDPNASDRFNTNIADIIDKTLTDLE